ncbi:response regulator [Sphingobacterium sp. lm-10]|uniref:hybrid sensor histidine kinase/response regulator transcription factor n=1 Tax=Sphingobacterium sp. lm-10 TaxID=2944904 RepID=UPI0020209759|nr:two-component regulator propeller domain-containing protein [Sphingobacterium sp. lm-10]MCL7986692.1 response regulator [Sphingobacterium sp. lm-10]
MNILILLFLFATAISNVKAESNPAIRYVGIEQGLSNNNVTSIFEDSDGFMWFGTFDGLNRFDGDQFMVFKNQPEDRLSLPDNRITDISQDANGRLWVASKSGFAKLDADYTHFQRVRWKDYLPFRSDHTTISASVNQLAYSATHGILAATSLHGLLQVNTENDQPLATKIPLQLSNGQKNLDYNAQGVVSTSANEIWVFIHNHGLCRLNPQSNALEVVDDQIKNSVGIKVDENGRSIWVASNENRHTLYEFDLRKKAYSTYQIDPTLVPFEITALYAKYEKVFLGSEGKGIIEFDKRTNQFQQYQKNTNWMKSMTVYSMYIDQMQRNWIGTLRSGIHVVDNRLARFHLIQPGSATDRQNAKNFILSFANGKNNDLWIGTDGAGMMHWNRKKQSFTHYAADDNTHTGKLNNNFITGILADENGFVWATTYGGGINRLDPKTGTFKQYICFSPKNNRVYSATWKIFEDSQKRIWASTIHGGGLFCYNAVTDQFEVKTNDIIDVLSIFEEAPEVMWFGSWSTVTMRNFKTGEQKVINTDFPVRDIFTDNDGYVWLATEGGGLLRYEKSTCKLKRYSEKNGLPSNTVLNILKDNTDTFWLSTYNGLSNFNPKSEIFTNYYDSDGLQSNQFSYNAAIKLPDGSLAFGGIHGFNLFHPTQLKSLQRNSKVVFTALNINNKPTNQFTESKSYSSANHIEKLTIPFSNAVLNVHFSALEYSFPTKIKYAYYLDGWDKDWNYVDNLKTANYTNVKEGKYTLRIKSTNADGVWSDSKKTLQIIILPPWWRSIWAYLAYLALFATGIVAYLRYDRKQIRLRYEIDLAKVNAEKKKELHEKQIAFFTHIAHEFRNPLTLIVNPLKEMSSEPENHIDREDIQGVYRNSKRLLNLVDKLLLFRKTESGMDRLRLVQADIVSLTREVFTCFQQQATLQHIHYVFDSNINHHLLLVDREKMEICLFNLISNAFKYTPNGGSIRIALHYRSVDFSIQVIDTGCGIANQHKDQVFHVFERDYIGNSNNKGGFGIGLFLVKSFISAHKGSIAHRPHFPAGTQFEILLQNGKAHLSEFTIFEDVVEHSASIDEYIATSSARKASNDNAVVENATNVSNDSNITAQELTRDYQNVVTDKKAMVVVDDNAEIRKYLRKMFHNEFEIREADCAETGISLIEQTPPDIIISDVVMGGMSGIDLCQHIKNIPALSHIPIILLTASNSPDIKLKGLEGKADDYVTKPFERELLIARVNNLIQSRSHLQRYFYDEITLQQTNHKISKEHRAFLEKSIAIVEENLDQETFSVKELAEQIGMSHSNFYKRIKAISGKSANEFIRFVRLRKVAQLLIETDANVSEAAFAAGFNDIKYFRTQFSKVFGMKPSEFKKKYDALRKNHRLTI